MHSGAGILEVALGPGHRPGRMLSTQPVDLHTSERVGTGAQQFPGDRVVDHRRGGVDADPGATALAG